jgi:hypothetical protein
MVVPSYNIIAIHVSGPCVSLALRGPMQLAGHIAAIAIAIDLNHNVCIATS